MEQYKSAKAFIEAAHKEERASFEKEREELLISLGLFDEEKTSREYSDDRVYPFVNWDNETGKYYYDKKVPLAVTDEEYLEIKRIAKTKEVEEEIYINNSAERTLNGFNIAMLIICLVGAFFLFIMSCNAYRGEGIYIAGAIVLVLLGLYNWAIMKVFINISNNLHQINKKQK